MIVTDYVNLTRTIIKYRYTRQRFRGLSHARARASVCFGNYRKLWSKFMRYTNRAGREIRRTTSGITSITLISSRDLIDRSKSLFVECNLKYSLVLSCFVTLYDGLPHYERILSSFSFFFLTGFCELTQYHVA